MNTRSVNSAAGVILAALQQNRVPAGIALALDSAGLLMTPETARELAELRARVAELESALEGQRAGHFTEAARLLEDTGRDDDAVNLLDNVAAGIQAHAEGEHYAATHHTYRVGRDLPPLDGAQ
ncbi:hypothetical protein [Streptomyces sp. NPDC052015]|uniref:hypothetical protein n=1 Tax=Streptomyces sp. NPDC052015 TaxID=3154755 RepID=UPI0034372FA6